MGIVSLCVVAGLLGIFVTPTAALAKASKVPPLVVVDNDPWGTSWSYNLYSPEFAMPATDAVLLPLASQSQDSLTTFMPQLASGWKVEPGRIVVTLRKGAVWQDGSPVDSRDVLDAVLLDGVDANGVWSDIRRVSEVTGKEVSFSTVAGASPELALDSVLSITPIPAGVYGRFVTPRLAKAVPAYYAAYRANPEAAPKSALGSFMTDQLTKLESYNPPLSKFIGDGPYRLLAMNHFEAKLAKSATFFGAKRVHVPKLVWQATTTSNNEAEMLSHSADFSWTGLTWLGYKEEMEHGVHVDNTGGISANGIIFNFKHYPLNLVQVRQAIAYIVHRPAVVALGNGGRATDEYTPYPTWMGKIPQREYLTESEIRSLNPYSYNPKKATKLLESVGFHKKASNWLLPNGSPFTLTISAITGFISADVALVVSKYLSEFGIKTALTPLANATYGPDIEKGEFEMAWEGSSALDPLEGISSELSSLNFIAAGEPGMGFGPTKNVRGLGRIDVPAVLGMEARAASGAKLRRLAGIWARYVDEELPVLEIFAGTQQEQYSTAHYVDWAPASNQYWPYVVEQIEQGYVRPKT